MNKSTYQDLLKSSTAKQTFVAKKKKELHATVRGYLTQAVQHFASKDSTVNHAMIGIRAAYEFKPAYANHVRVAMSKVCAKYLFKCADGVVSKQPHKKDFTPVEVAKVVAEMNERLDTIDEDAKPAERTPEQKLASQAKSFTTGLVNLDGDKFEAVLGGLDGLEGDDLQNLYANVCALQSKIEGMLTLKAVG